MTTVVISQPLLFPWLGFFELVAQADIYVHLDDVQLPDKGFTNRVQVKRAEGFTWMTIPVQDRTARKQIRECSAAEGPWRRRHRELLRNSLAKAPHVDDALALFDQAYDEPGFVELLIKSIQGPADYLGIRSRLTEYRSSDLDVDVSGSERILELVQRVGGDRYLTAHGAANYLDHEAFERAGVEVSYVEYSKAEYPQLHGAFTPYVTVLDAIANLGNLAGEALHPKAVPWRAFVEQHRTGKS